MGTFGQEAIRMETVTSADGTTVTFERTGHGPPLVLLHGTGRDRSYWAACLPELAKHATVHIVDSSWTLRSGCSRLASRIA